MVRCAAPRAWHHLAGSASTRDVPEPPRAAEARSRTTAGRAHAQRWSTRIRRPHRGGAHPGLIRRSPCDDGDPRDGNGGRCARPRLDRAVLDVPACRRLSYRPQCRRCHFRSLPATRRRRSSLRFQRVSRSCPGAAEAALRPAVPSAEETPHEQYPCRSPVAPTTRRAADHGSHHVVRFAGLRADPHAARSAGRLGDHRVAGRARHAADVRDVARRVTRRAAPRAARLRAARRPASARRERRAPPDLLPAAAPRVRQHAGRDHDLGRGHVGDHGHGLYPGPDRDRDHDHDPVRHS